MKWISKKGAKQIMLYPALFLFLIYIVFPIIITLYYSFTDFSGIGKPNFVATKNYATLLKDRIFINSVENTLIIIGMILLLIIPLSFLLALLINKLTKGSSLVKALNFAPFVVAPILVGLIWYFILDPTIGLVNNLLSMLKLDSWKQEWIGGKNLTPYSVAFVYLWQVLGYYATIYLAGLKAIPTEIDEAAVIDGANRWQHIWYITIPMLKETTIIVVILIITGGFKIFETVQQLTGGGPNHLSDVLVTYMYHVTFTTSRYGYGMAIASVTAVFSLISTCAYLIISRKNMGRGGENE